MGQNQSKEQRSKTLLDLPAELTFRIAAYAQMQHRNGQKDDMIEDESKLLLFTDYHNFLHTIVTDLIEALPRVQGTQWTEVISRIRSLQHMVDHDSGLPIVNVVGYIGPKAGHSITTMKPCSLSQVCRRFRHESVDFVRGFYHYINLRHESAISLANGLPAIRMAVGRALVTIAQDIERFPMRRHLKIAFYNIDRGHEPLQANPMAAHGTLHGVDTRVVNAWYSRALEIMTSVSWSSQEICSGGYLTGESWLTFVYKLSGADDISTALAEIKTWSGQ